MKWQYNSKSVWVWQHTDFCGPLFFWYCDKLSAVEPFWDYRRIADGKRHAKW